MRFPAGTARRDGEGGDDRWGRIGSLRATREGPALGDSGERAADVWAGAAASGALAAAFAPSARWVAGPRARRGEGGAGRASWAERG